MSELEVTLTVNGQRRRVQAEPRKTLADVLRQDLLLTGTHLACEHGVCGSCTVLVDGLAGSRGRSARYSAPSARNTACSAASAPLGSWCRSRPSLTSAPTPMTSRS